MQQDLGIALPPVEVDIASLDHPVLLELCRLAASAPAGQKRILSIQHPLVYRLRHGRWRGATWVEDPARRFWLCAAAPREQGSADDAYEQFAALHTSGRLLPGDDDGLRDRLEQTARTLAHARQVIPAAVAEALRERDRDVLFTVEAAIDGRLYVPAACDEAWIAISTQLPDQSFVPERLRDLLFVIAQEAAQAVLAEPRADWPTGELEWHEVARLALRDP